jgi:cyanophycinase-like exopeptidase
MNQPGPIILFGSGESGAHARKVYEWLFGALPEPPQVAILETPAGFEPNSAQVAGRMAAYLERHLLAFQPRVTIVPARQRGSAFSPDDPALAAPIAGASVVLAGAGSPTYAIRQLRDSPVWEALLACHQRGGAVVLSSAAAIAASAQALPVYEIYKVGEELHWREGLNLLGPYGLSLAIVPHWNNGDGGRVDTRRCYMGQPRFEALQALLDPESTVLALDEHTALLIDIATETCRVMGLGYVTVITAGQTHRFGSGERFSIQSLGPFVRPPTPPLPESPPAAPVAPLPAQVLRLLDERQAARAHQEWEVADAIRAQIAAMGWRVLDTPEGTQVRRT